VPQPVGAVLPAFFDEFFANAVTVVEQAQIWLCSARIATG